MALFCDFVTLLKGIHTIITHTSAEHSQEGRNSLARMAQAMHLTSVMFNWA